MRGQLSWEGGRHCRKVAHSTTWTLETNRSGPQSPARPGYAPERGCRRAWRRQTSYTPRGSVAGGFGWQVTWALLPLSLRRKRLKVKGHPRAFPPLHVPWTPVHAVSLGPVPSEVPTEWMGPRGHRSVQARPCSHARHLPFPGASGGGGGRGRRSGARRAGAVLLLLAPWHPDGEGGESDAVGKMLKVTL